MTKDTPNYKWTGVATDWTNDSFPAWIRKNDHWNGWDIPLFPESTLPKLLDAYSDILTYDEATDTVSEVFDPNQHDSPEDCMSWKGAYNEELQAKIYGIGAGYWTWTEWSEEDARKAREAGNV